MKGNLHFPDPNGLNSRRIESFYNDFAAFCTKHFGAQPCDLALDWHNVGAVLRFKNILAHIDINLWIVSDGTEGLPDNLVRVENWSYYPLRAEIHSAESLRDFIKKQLDKGIGEDELNALQDLFFTQAATAKSMAKEFQDKVIKFLAHTSLIHNFAHLAFDDVRPSSRPAEVASRASDEIHSIPAPSYSGTLYRLSE